MDKLSDVLTSPVWWFTVVIAGIAINIISIYIKKSLDERLSTISSWWRNRSEKRKAEFEDLVQRLVNDPREQTMACYNGLRQIIYAFIFILFGTVCFILGMLSVILLESINIPFFLLIFIAMLCFMHSIVELMSELSIPKALEECQRRHRQAEQGLTDAASKTSA